MISYITKDYVGFRKITIKGPHSDMQAPEVIASHVDINGVCLYLAPDAFVVWEDLVSYYTDDTTLPLSSSLIQIRYGRLGLQRFAAV